MQKKSRLQIAAAILAVVAITLGADAFAADKGETMAASPSAGLDRLKQLTGEWVMDGGDGSVAVTYKVTAGGSAIVETLFPGTPHEMVSVYHRDGKDLVMTHYCMLGNQPRMKAAAGSAANQLVFKFAGAGNMKSPQEAHMHGATITFVDPDHVKSEWTEYEDGKQKEVKKFDFIRKKS